jgi:hypothetical protein
MRSYRFDAGDSQARARSAQAGVRVHQRGGRADVVRCIARWMFSVLCQIAHNPKAGVSPSAGPLRLASR